MEISEIIKSVHAQWIQAKSHLEERCRAGGRVSMASKLASCNMFRGVESLDQLAALFMSPQGIEFCIASRFPTLAVFRQFKPYNVDRFGIYIDAGDITLKNPHRAVLIGRTAAKIVYTENKPLHKLTLLRGASAAVTASGWAVVGVTQEYGCKLIKNTTENGIILC